MSDALEDHEGTFSIGDRTITNFRYAVVEEDGTSGLVIEVFDTWIRLVLMLYFFMIARKAACQTLSKAFLKSMKTW